MTAIPVPALARPFSCNPLDRSSAHQSLDPIAHSAPSRAAGQGVGQFSGCAACRRTMPVGKRQPAAQPCLSEASTIS